jgi:integrase/recombinase XerD
VSSPRELMEPYLAERSLYVSASTVTGDLFHLSRFVDELEDKGLSHVGLITFEVLDRYRHQLDTVPGERGSLYSDAFKHKALQVPRLFLLWSFREGHTLVDFSSYPLPHRTLPEIEVPSVEQVRKLLEAPDASRPPGRRDRLILESFYTLGLRRRESHRLDIGDLNFTQQTVRVVGKRQRERLLPLSQRLCRLLADYLKESRPYLRPFPGEQALWVSPQNGTRLSYTYLRSIVWRNSQKLGLGKIYPHLLRHACATHMLEAGAKLEQIQAFLGHNVPSSTERYAQVTDAELRREFERCHPRCCVRQGEPND